MSLLHGFSREEDDDIFDDCKKIKLLPRNFELESYIKDYLESEIKSVKQDHEILKRQHPDWNFKELIDCLSPELMANNIIFIIEKHKKIKEEND